MNPYPSYQPGLTANGNGGGYAQHGPTQYAGYGSVSYPNSAAVADIQSMDTRRRAIEALNDFLGDIKRRAINPNTYYDVGQRLQGTSLPLPVGTGYNTGYNSTSNTYNGMSAANLLEAFNHGDLSNTNAASLHGPVAQPGYSLPLPNARTKNDLQDIDRFLEQLQATVYETSNQAAAAGVQQPGMHAQYTNDYGLGSTHQYQRSSHSPPSFHSVSGASSFGGISMVGTTAGPASTGFDSPLTAASDTSYGSSGQSPSSSHGRSSMTSMTGSAMYPSLPSVTSMSDLGSGYPSTTSAPAASLASGFDGLDGRRYSGGRLQRVAPDHDTEMADADDRDTTPKAEDSNEPKSKGNSSLDPALRGEDGFSDSVSTPSADDKRQEDWVENIRAIEALRKWISSRLEQGDFDGTALTNDEAEPAEESAQQMAETAKMVEEKMADAEAAVTASEGVEEDANVQYPALPSA